MADLIVPPSPRQRHRQGLARFLEGGAARSILDRRLELTGMRRDGTEFPVELTITRIALPGPPTFTGYIRDITDRARRGRRCCASRARLVEVADEERQRIQRNLHDGAQQRLTAVLLTPRAAPRVRRRATRAARPARSTSSRAGSRRSASSRAASTRPCSPSAGSAPRSRRSRSRAPVPVELQAVPSGRCRSRSRRPPTTSSRRRSRTPTSTPARPTSPCACEDGGDGLQSRSRTTASAAPTPRAAACAASSTGSRRSVAT